MIACDGKCGDWFHLGQCVDQSCMLNEKEVDVQKLSIIITFSFNLHGVFNICHLFIPMNLLCNLMQSCNLLAIT